MMEQMEFEDLINRIKKRKSEGDIKNAMKVADKVPWDEIDDVNLLVYAASVYEEGEHYKDAKLILEYAYEIAPVKNRLYFALSLICAKCKEVKDATNYYIDFCEAFPNDMRKMLLQYYIMNAKGASLDQQKRLLMEYLSEEKDEKMTFELALICDKLGEREEVLKYCNFIIDFFGVKRTGYGKNALLLKKKYVTLTDTEEKLLEEAELNYVRDENAEIEYREPPELYNATRLEEDKVSIPVEKVKRVENVEEQEKLNELMDHDEDKIDDTDNTAAINISYTPDEESYAEKERNKMAFLSSGKADKEKLKSMINRLKMEEEIANSEFNRYRQKSFERKGRLKDMKLNETKLNMIIEAHSKEEGVEIAQKELAYIHDVLGEKTHVAKASAYNMNENGFDYYIDKIKGKDLIIENGGQLRNEVLDAIEEYIINKKGDTIFALVDIINNFDKLATDRPSFIGRFDVYSVLSNRPQESLEVTSEEIDEYKRKKEFKSESKMEKIVERPKANVREDSVAVPKEPPKTNVALKSSNLGKKIGLSVDEFVEECKSYAKSIDCSMSADTITALYDKAEDMLGENIQLTAENAMALIEEAADRAEKPKLFSKPKYDKDGCLILKEEHFDF